MKTKWKLVPVDVLKNLLHCGDTDTFITPYVTARIREILNEDTVPPAGKVEVLLKRRSYEESFTVHGQGQIMGWNACLEAYTPIITRLTAENARLQAEFKDLLHTGVREDVFDVVCKEREALKAEVERLNKDWSDETAEHRITQVNRDTWRSNYHEAQSELTKARELLTTGRSVVRGSEYKLNGGIAWLYGVENFLARQTAPAAKGGE